MNYRFQNLLGAPYRGGNAIVVNNTLLISPVGNRISVTDLVKSETITLPCQASSNISRIAASPDGVFLLAVDDNSRCLFINLRRRAVLHRIAFKNPVASAKFSPDGSFIAVASGKLVQIWRSPGFKKEFFPFELVKTFANCNDKVTALDWSPDSDYVLAGSKDLTVRLFCLKKLSGSNKPFLFLGHRDIIVGAFFGIEKKTKQVSRVYTVSRDGAIFSWSYTEKDEIPSPGTPEQTMEVEQTSNVKKRKNSDAIIDEETSTLLHTAKWELSKKNFFMQTPAKLTSCDYHRGLEIVVVGFSNGVFGLYQMPDFVCIHLLSISREKITTATFNDLGNWLTFGCARLGQLLVWEWKSESYILKQQGHYFDVNTLAYSPDSQLLATGADDNKIKVSYFHDTISSTLQQHVCLQIFVCLLQVWTVSSGFCFVTFSEHTNAVTALHFMASNHCLLSASLDGTVRAWDLFRYRNFRTFTTPSSRQFVSLASDQSGEVICAGTLDSFEVIKLKLMFKKYLRKSDTTLFCSS